MSDAPAAKPAASEIGSPTSRPHRDLFLISFLILFFELACIRWFGSAVIFLTFFTNLVLMACFLGMSVGLLTASKKQHYLRSLIPLTLFAVVLAIATLELYHSFSKINVDLGGQASPQQIYFGTEYRANDPSQVVIPLEVIAGIFFVLIAVIFVGLGQEMGRSFNAIPNRVAAYTTDIAGSLSGIVLFGLASYLQTPPIVWFGISMALVWYLLWPRIRHLWQQAATRMQVILQFVSLFTLLLIVWVVGQGKKGEYDTYWSPYYRINYQPQSQVILTNNIGHQTMIYVQKSGSAYVLPHLLNRDAGNRPFQDVLVIGAGSGNDVQAARSFGAQSIDGVEIDPVIYRLGQSFHPNQPYSDPRIRIHLDDGRSFVKKTDKKYDLVVYAVVDSLVLHSGYSSLRLESFLFTKEALQDVKARLKPNGVFAMYNYYRQGWVVARLDKMAEEVFGRRPLVISLPYQEEIGLAQPQQGAFTFVLSGNTDAIRNSLQNKGFFWVHDRPAFNLNINAYGATPPRVTGADPALWRKIGPARIDTSSTNLYPTDNWPFLYLRERTIPALNLRGMAVVAVLSLVILMAFASPRVNQINWQMLFLGAGFMLLETKGVVHMALLFGSTWIVNSIVFGAILVMILLSNLYVLKAKPRKLWPYYALLIAALAINALVPMNTFLALPDSIKILVSCAVFFIPVFFAGVIFASVFRDSQRPDIDFGSNVAGIIIGGLSEYFSLILGFNYLLLIAITFYVLSMIFKPRLPIPGIGGSG